MAALSPRELRLLRSAVANVAAARTLGPLTVTIELVDGSLRVGSERSLLSIARVQDGQVSHELLQFSEFATLLLDLERAEASCLAQ
jgi:hypothetical protein